MLNLQAILILSASGLRCSAASAAGHGGRDMRCNIHDLKQRAEYTTIGAFRRARRRVHSGYG
jgi:hypothetical protein